jgi:thymidine kinase
VIAPSVSGVSLPGVIRTQPTRGGWLEVVCGPMFSGKSEELIRRLRRAEIAGQRALIVKPTIDNRYDVGHVVSHAGAKMRAVTAASSADVERLAAGYDAIGIDEVQFFDDGIVDAIGGLVESGARVVAAGLAQDFRGLPFGAMPTLLCVAEFVDKLEAVCHRCGGPATMTQRLVDGEPAPFEGETIQVGALDSYEARCRACHSLSHEPEAARAAQ